MLQWTLRCTYLSELWSHFKKSTSSPLLTDSTVCPQMLLCLPLHPCQSSDPLPSTAVSQLPYLHFNVMMDDIDIPSVTITSIKSRSIQKLTLNEKWKGKDKLLIIWVNDTINPHGDLLCTYEFLESEHWAHHSGSLGGRRRKWDGSGWPKGTWASLAMFYFLKRRMYSCCACVIKL